MSEPTLCNCGHPRNFHAYGMFGSSCRADCATVDGVRPVFLQPCPCQRYTPRPEPVAADEETR